MLHMFNAQMVIQEHHRRVRAVSERAHLRPAPRSGRTPWSRRARSKPELGPLPELGAEPRPSLDPSPARP